MFLSKNDNADRNNWTGPPRGNIASVSQIIHKLKKYTFKAHYEYSKVLGGQEV
jgi:hypothetical protein